MSSDSSPERRVFGRESAGKTSGKVRAPPTIDMSALARTMTARIGFARPVTVRGPPVHLGCGSSCRQNRPHFTCGKRSSLDFVHMSPDEGVRVWGYAKLAAPGCETPQIKMEQRRGRKTPQVVVRGDTRQ